MYLLRCKTKCSIFYLKIKRNFIFLHKIHTCSIRLKRFEDIPGPKSLATIGTLYQYFPIVGKSKMGNSYLEMCKTVTKMDINHRL